MNSNLMRDYVINLLKDNKRIDGRKLDQYREIKVEYGISSKVAEGSARVSIGDTVVVAGVKMEVGTPFPDKPDEGTIMAGVELLPLSSPNFESGPPSVESIELARSVVDRGIRESHAIDFKKLSIEAGEKCWLVHIDVYSMDDSGNLADAIGLAAIAAVKDAKFPEYDKKNDRVNYMKHKDKLQVMQLPIPVTLVKIGDKIVVDPNKDEKEVISARLTVSVVEDGRICAMQKGGDEPLTFNDIDMMVSLAIEKSKELRKML